MKKITSLLACLSLAICSMLPTTARADNQGYTQLSAPQLEHQLIPMILNSVRANTPDSAFLTQPSRIFNDLLPRLYAIPPFDAVEVKVSTVPSEGGQIIVWELPEPTEITACKYIAFVPWDDVYRMYGLEKTLDLGFLDEKPAGEATDSIADTDNDGLWVLGSSAKSGHTNFGTVARPKSAEEFARLLIDKGLLFDREKYEASLKPMTRTEWEHTFLPMLLPEPEVMTPDGMAANPDYVSGRMLKGRDIRPVFPAGAVTCTIYKSDNGYIFVWTLPEPDEATQSRYIAFVPADDHYNMLMQCRANDKGKWTLGMHEGVQDAKFTDLGSIKPSKDPADFLQKLQDRGYITASYSPL